MDEVETLRRELESLRLENDATRAELAREREAQAGRDKVVEMAAARVTEIAAERDAARAAHEALLYQYKACHAEKADADAAGRALVGACIQKTPTVSGSGWWYACRLCGHDWGGDTEENHFDECALLTMPTRWRTGEETE